MGETDKLKKLDIFEIGDPNAPFTFTHRLARENSWTDSYAKRVVTEYKRFMYLASISESAVTPSDAVDQAWHLHLSYTKSYWNDFCKNILNVEIHHNPTLGGPSQQKLFEQQYTSTLRLYELTFGELPPADIWPNVNVRFGNANDFVRINRAKNWLVPKPEINFRVLAACAFVPTLLVACGASVDNKQPWLWLVIGLCVALLLVMVCFGLAYSRKHKGKSNGNTGNGFFGGCGGAGAGKGGDGGSGCGGGGCGGGG